MSNKQSSYRQIVKATSIFGGVQVFQIIIGIIRSKFIAVLLGPTGMGIAGILNATLGFIAALTNFGLGTSAVRDIADAHNSNNENRLIVVSTVFKRWIWITGTLGFILTAVLSPWLSELSFGNRDYTFAFVWISITLLINQISTGQAVILRGMRKIGYLAQSSMIGSVIGLLTTLPLYYFYGLKGIVPGIIITAITSLALTWFYEQKLNLKSVFVSLNQTIIEGKGMLKIGFLISLSGLITVGASFVVRIFINNNGGIEQVGLYNAGFTVINMYVGMIFTAMATDYYPRLSSVSHCNTEMKAVVNQQSEIAILIMAPVLIIFLVFIDWVVILLYSDLFLPITKMIYWAALGMFFKAATWSVGFIFLSKGDSKLFFRNEVLFNFYMLVLNIIGYKYWGLSGLGVSFLIAYILYFLQVYLVSKSKFSFSFNSSFIKIFFFQFTLAIISFLAVQIFSSFWAYGIGLILLAISSWYSWKQLDERLDIKGILSTFKSKF